MADLPIINNLKDKLIPSRTHDEDEDIFNDHDKNSGSPEHDVLEQYRIDVNTELNDDIITPSKLNKVRFGVTQPKGFSFKQVEAFHTEVTKSIQWYIATLEKRDRDVHKLATEIDKYKTDVQNTRFQLEVLQGMGGQAMVDETGAYVTESQLSDVELKAIELENLLAQANNDLAFERKVNADLRKELDSKPAQQISLPPVNVPLPGAVPTNAELEELYELRQRQVELDEWENQVVEEYNRIEGELEETKSKLAVLKGQLDGLTLSSGASFDEMEALSNQLASVNGSLEKVTADYEAVSAELDELRNAPPVVAQDESVVEELEISNAKITELNAHIDSLDKYIDTLVEEATKLGTEMEAKERSIEALALAVAEKEKAVAELTLELEEKEKTIATYPVSAERIPGYGNLPEGITAEDLGLL